MKSRIIASVISAILISILAALSVIQSSQAAGSRLEILGGPLVVQPDEKQENRMLAMITVSNNGPEIAQLNFRAISDDGGNISIKVNKDGIAKYSVDQYEVEFLDPITEEITGHIIIEAPDIEPATEAFTLVPGLNGVKGILWLDQLNTSLIILISFLVGFVFITIVSIVLIFFSRKNKIGEIFKVRMSGLKWDFKENWASTFVAVGGILATIVGSKLMPENPLILSAQGFQMLNILFPILIVVAPFLLSALNALGKEPKKDGNLILDTDGKSPLLILPFVVGSAIVTWAVIGELMTLAVLFQELSLAEYITSSIAQCAQVLILLLCLLGIYYAIEKIVQTSMSAKILEEFKKLPQEQRFAKEYREGMNEVLAQMIEKQGPFSDEHEEKRIERPVYLP